MTNSTPNIPILDDDAVGEIEARANAATPAPWMVQDSCSWRRIGTAEPYADGNVICPITQYGDNHPDLLAARPDLEFVAHAREDVPALCATVRALRVADRHHYDLWLDLKERHKHKFADADGKWADTCSQCGVTTGDDHDGYDCIAWLQRQLEQVTKERDEEKRLRAELKQIANAGFDDISSLGTTLKENAVIDFRSRAIALCRDKAVEYRKELEHYERGEEEFAQLNSYAAAADVLARELEQLK